MGKPRGKATDPLIHSKGRTTLLLEPEERARACTHSRRGLTPLGILRSTLRSMTALERNPQVPAPTPHKVLSQRDTAATAREESARAGPQLRRGLTPLGKLRSTPSSMSAVEMNPQVPAPTPHMVLCPVIDGRISGETPEQLAWGLAFPEATRPGP